MADFTVATGSVGAHGITLTANTERSVLLEGWVDTVEVASLVSSTPVYFTLDGTVPTVAGSHCYLLFPGMNAAQVDVPASANGAAGLTVRLIAAASATVSVVRAA